MKTKYNIKKLSQKSKIEFLKNLMEAAVDPVFLKKVSDILKRELKAEKDTEDYNTKVVSSHFDRPSIILRQAGQKNSHAGDVYKISEKMLSVQQDRDDINFFFDNIQAVGTYEFFPFSWQLGQEIRSHFILNTERSDTFDKLLDEVDGLIFNYLTIDQWTILKNAIKLAEQRIKKNNVKFLDPEISLGTQEQLTNAEVARYDITDLSKVSVIDNRSDDHDLLALKEFVNMLKGEYVHPLTIGPGFFAKYMPELVAAKVSAVLFKVVDHRLVDMKLNMIETETDLIEFSPLDAAKGLAEQFCQYTKKSLFSKGTRDFSKSGVFSKDARYYVVVDGCVCGPKAGKPQGYESISVNDQLIEAGEVFLFEENEGQVQATRLYFVPYDYSKLHLMHQHGSVVFGNNDQSFNSCVKNEKIFFNDDDAIDDLVSKIDKDDKILYDPAFYAAATHFLPKGADPEVLINEVNHGLLFKAMGSMFEETSFTAEFILKTYSLVKKSEKDLITELLKNVAPISKRFILGKYFQDENGLMLDKMETTYSILSERTYHRYHIALMRKNLAKMNTDKK